MSATPPRLVDVQKLRNAPFYSLRTRTGLITAIAAATASAGHLIAVRNSAAPKFHVTRLRLEWSGNADPSTTAQRIGFEVAKLTGYSAAHTGGTAATTGNPYGRSTSGDYAALSAVAHRTAGTDALTAGTQTIGETIAMAHEWALADTSTLKKVKFTKEWKADDRHPIAVLGASEGLLVRNTVLMANSLAGYLELELDGWVG